MMRTLLKQVENVLNKEFPDASVRLNYIWGRTVPPNLLYTDIHGMIIFYFNYKNEKITYKLCTISHRYSKHMDKNADEKALKYITDALSNMFITNILFSRGELNVVSLLNGDAEPNENLLIN